MHSRRGKWTSRKLVLMNPLTISSEGLVFKTTLNEFYSGYVWRHDPNLEKKNIFTRFSTPLSLPTLGRESSYLFLSFLHHHFMKLLAKDQEYYLQAFSVSTRAFILIPDIRPRFENNGKLWQTKFFLFFLIAKRNCSNFLTRNVNRHQYHRQLINLILIVCF